MARSVVGLFPDRGSAERAITDLKAAGFDPSRIGIVMRDRDEARSTAEERGISSTTGAVTGGVLGGTAGALLAATGALIVPGIGPFISGGILATALVGGAAGWLVGGLVGLGIPHDEAKYYEGRVEQGSTLLTVDASGREAEATDILRRNGAENLEHMGYGGYPSGPTYEREPMPQQEAAQSQATPQATAPAYRDRPPVNTFQEEPRQQPMQPPAIPQGRPVEPLGAQQPPSGSAPYEGPAQQGLTDDGMRMGQTPGEFADQNRVSVNDQPLHERERTLPTRPGQGSAEGYPEGYPEGYREGYQAAEQQRPPMPGQEPPQTMRDEDILREQQQRGQ